MGRPKGSKNKRGIRAELIALGFPKDPFEILMLIANGDWKGLGFSSKTRLVHTQAGTNEEETVPLAQRCQAAREASRYLHAQRQSVEVSAGTEGFKIVIEDYSKK